MAITGFISDDHDSGFLERYRIVSNHINKISKGKHTVIHGGNFSSKDEAFMGVQQGVLDPAEAIDSRRPKYEAINEELGKFDAEVYGVLGNNDCPEAREVITNMTFLDAEDKTYRINGRNVYGISHSSGNVFNRKEDRHSTIKEREATLDDKLNKADWIVTHEGITPESCAGKTSYNSKLNKKAKARAAKRPLINLCGHAHKPQTTNEDGITTVRSYTQQKRGSAYFILHEGAKDTIYEVSVSKIYEEAERLAPEEFNEDKSRPFVLPGQNGEKFVAFHDTPENIKKCLSFPLPSQRLQTTDGKPVIAFSKDHWDSFMDQQAQLQQNQAPQETPQDNPEAPEPIDFPAEEPAETEPQEDSSSEESEPLAA
ncbi:hypothetical protein HN592_02480 [Candidatus Woesearchaeota archaeon]|jgi:Icc-related predicted phosphoesterase|nr:hypothetical protein [Candidatus Woesearchaeota archaeon]MBT4368078.1 hypothetical protein [Candidatus Woesearchaeota archaeon]MBT4712566.1 hypothetical protein [Candidatus Woesearchaeota archaeon]MBT6639479.1 hypothetical protein [Candidatus Woesearchaeota archaeon]MBT7133651.1 hypothetical protein [Candidatus Woesearchaeota archaeon]